MSSPMVTSCISGSTREWAARLWRVDVMPSPPLVPRALVANRAQMLVDAKYDQNQFGRDARENDADNDAGYQLLDLITYFTAGPKEARAWTIHRGTKAPAAAGVIHTDFEKGFIRAETIAYADYVALGGEAGARDGGKLRLEGKEYVVADGDVMHFRFNT